MIACIFSSVPVRLGRCTFFRATPARRIYYGRPRALFEDEATDLRTLCWPTGGKEHSHAIVVTKRVNLVEQELGPRGNLQTTSFKIHLEKNSRRTFVSHVASFEREEKKPRSTLARNRTMPAAKKTGGSLDWSAIRRRERQSTPGVSRSAITPSLLGCDTSRRRLGSSRSSGAPFDRFGSKEDGARESR